jgi:hypothetical protein
MDRRNPPPPLSLESIDLTCTDSEDEEKKESSLIPAINLTSMLDDNNSDIDGGDVSKEENGKIQRKRHIAQSEQRFLRRRRRRRRRHHPGRNPQLVARETPQTILRRQGFFLKIFSKSIMTAITNINFNLVIGVVLDVHVTIPWILKDVMLAYINAVP